MYVAGGDDQLKLSMEYTQDVCGRGWRLTKAIYGIYTGLDTELMVQALGGSN